MFIRLDKAPLYSAGKSRSTASAQAGCLYFVYNVEARHCHGLLELLVAAIVQISIDVCGPILAADVFENEAMLQRMGGVDVAHLGGSRENLSGLLRLHILMQAIIDHADGRRSTAGEAFNEFDSEFPVGSRLRAMRMRVEPKLLAKVFVQFIGTAERAA